MGKDSGQIPVRPPRPGLRRPLSTGVSDDERKEVARVGVRRRGPAEQSVWERRCLYAAPIAAGPSLWWTSTMTEKRRLDWLWRVRCTHGARMDPGGPWWWRAAPVRVSVSALSDDRELLP